MKTQYLSGHRGLRLAADVGGEPDSPTVIFLHGGGQTRHSWKQAASELEQKGYHVIAPDWRGHGESEWDKDGDYTLDALVQDLAAIIDSLQAPAILVGASLGGVVSLTATPTLPENSIAGIVLVDVVPQMEVAGIDAIRNFMMDNQQGFESVDQAAEAVAAYLPHRPKPSNPEGLKKNLRTGNNGRLYWHWDPAVMNEINSNDFDQRMESASKQITAPVMLLKGALSEVVSARGVDALKQLIPHLEYLEIGGTSHMVAGDDNNAFNQAIKAFVSRYNPLPASEIL